MLSVLLSIAVSSLPAQPACTLARIAPSESKALIAGRRTCGECYISGRPGIVVWDGKISDCSLCGGGATEAPDQRLAGRDGFPEPRRGTGQGSSFKLTPQA